MNRFRRPLVATVVSIALCGPLIAQAQQVSSQRIADQQQSYRKAMEIADQQIADEVKAHSELMKNLEYLTTQIGPRLTGSPQMQQASDWALKRFQDYGINAHLETAQVEHAWTRGAETAEIESPIHRSIEIRALGWSKATSGEVSGKVIGLDLRKPSDLDPYRGKLKGAIVLALKPMDDPHLDPEPNNAYDAVIARSRGVQKDGEMLWRERAQLMRQIGEQQPALILL